MACGHDTVDGVVFDLGVSSMQLDEGERGFSFRLDGPLDMRMGASGPSAADVVALASERDLAAVIATLGEERHARAVARAIVRARAEAPIRTTRALADIVARVVHARPGAIHPATRTFQALRIFVNEELDELAAALEAAERILAPGGRLVVVAFHSLEDRIVKTFLADRCGRGGASRHQPELAKAAATFRLLTRRPLVPDEAEIAANPRARSAKLRAAERTDAPAEPRAARRCRGCRRSRCHGGAPMMRLLNICVIARSCWRRPMSTTSSSSRPGRRSASPSCAWRSGASTTPSRRCAPNGRSSTARRASRRSHGAISRCKPIDARQFDRLDNLPERPPELVPLDEPDPIGAVIANPELVDRTPTASLPPAKGGAQANANPPASRR